jgi:hypothetical protein
MVQIENRMRLNVSLSKLTSKFNKTRYAIRGKILGAIGYRFQLSINKTCCSNRDNFITEDTVKTESHFVHKDCL